MAPVKTYNGVYEPDREGNWLASVAEIPQVHTFGRTLAKAEANLEDALALWLDRDPSMFRLVHGQFKLPKAAVEAVAEAHRTREEARRAQAEAAQVTTDTARALVIDFGLSLRDAGQLLGLSHQRVQQLVSST